MKTTARNNTNFAHCFPARAISTAIGVSAKTVHRRAQRDGWRKYQRGYRVDYVVPRSLRLDYQALATAPAIFYQERTLRELKRAVAVLGFALEMRRNPHGGIERALKVTAANFRHLTKFSPHALRRWVSAVERGGLPALQEHKVGHVGRKSARLERILK